MSPTPRPAARSSRPRLTALLALVLVLAVSCGGSEGTADARSSPGGEVGQDGDGPADGETTASSEAGGPGKGGSDAEGEGGAAPDSGRSGGSSEGEAQAACRPGEGKTVTELPDVEIPAVHVDAIRTADQDIAGETVPGLDIPAIDIPARTVDGGCTIEYNAPAGCAPNVEITGIEVPAVEVPGVDVPAIDAGGLEVPAQSVAGETIAAESVPGEVVAQECQPREEEGYVAGVYRSGIYRSGIYRSGIYRSSIYRGEQCVEDECLPELDIDAVEIDAVEVAAAEVDAFELEAKDLPELPDVPIYDDGEETAYLAPADVLFAFDEAILAPAAGPLLTEIAAAARGAGSAPITVDGHTDSMGDEPYNLALSEDRAQAVADWLAANGGIDGGRITVTGYGEAAPVAPNEAPDGADDPAGRALNRRVVIAVAAP